MIGVVIDGAHVGQIGGATDVSGHVAGVAFSGQPSPGSSTNPKVQRVNPIIRLTIRPSRKPKRVSRVKNRRRFAELVLCIPGSVSFTERSSIIPFPPAISHLGISPPDAEHNPLIPQNNRIREAELSKHAF